MNVGDFIYNVHNGILRLGTIMEKELKPGPAYREWAYYRVNWHDDVQFMRAAMESDGKALREKIWWRVDELHLIDTHHLARSLHEHKTYNATNSPKQINIPAC